MRYPETSNNGQLLASPETTKTMQVQSLEEKHSSGGTTLLPEMWYHSRKVISPILFLLLSHLLLVYSWSVPSQRWLADKFNAYIGIRSFHHLGTQGISGENEQCIWVEEITSKKYLLIKMFIHIIFYIYNNNI